MNKRLLTNRVINTANFPDLPRSWYAPSEYLQRFASVKQCELTSTCSSAGDWEGYIVQRFGGWGYVIPFSQENNYPRAGFTLHTHNLAISFRGEMTDAEICDALYN